MKTQKFGTPEVSLSWFLEDDDYSIDKHLTTLSSEKGKKELINTILMLIEHGKEIRIGTDGTCLTLEANEADNEYTDSSYQYVNDDCEVMLRKEMPDGTYQYFFDEAEYQETLSEFLKEYPYYKQNKYGHWYNEQEQSKFKELEEKRNEAFIIEGEIN